MTNWKNQLEKQSSVRPNRVFAGWLAITAACVLSSACGGSTPTSPTASSSPSSPSSPPIIITSPSPTAPIAGNYTLSLRNAPTCPAASRDYSVTITQSGATIAINGPNTLDFQTTSIVTSFVGGIVSGSRFGVYILAWELSPAGTTTFEADGEMSGTVSGTAISGTLNGTLGRPTGLSACTAVNHSFTLRRR